jgi:hypothetical protein
VDASRALGAHQQGSYSLGTEILSAAKDDTLAPFQPLLPFLVGKNHYRASRRLVVNV